VANEAQGRNQRGPAQLAAVTLILILILALVGVVFGLLFRRQLGLIHDNRH
jgi:uncharacterized membrane protein